MIDKYFSGCRCKLHVSTPDEKGYNLWALGTNANTIPALDMKRFSAPSFVCSPPGRKSVLDENHSNLPMIPKNPVHASENHILFFKHNS